VNGATRGRPRHPDVLTPAEWLVVNAVRHGLSNRVIAWRRGISIDALKYHVENAMDKLGLKDRAALKHWQGVPIDSAINGRGESMTAQVRIGRVGQVSREVKDLKQAIAWFRDVLGLPLLGDYGNVAIFDMEGIHLFLSHHEDGNTSGNSIIYYAVDDIHAAYAGLSARGIDFEGAPHMIHRGPDGTETWMAFFHDMDGDHLAIMSEVKPG